MAELFQLRKMTMVHEPGAEWRTRLTEMHASCTPVSHVSACWLTGLGLGTPSKHLARTISWNAFKLSLLVCTTGAPPQITGSKCGPIRWDPALLTKIRNQDLAEITYIVNPLRPPPTLRFPPPPPSPWVSDNLSRLCTAKKCMEAMQHWGTTRVPLWQSWRGLGVDTIHHATCQRHQGRKKLPGLCHTTFTGFTASRLC